MRQHLFRNLFAVVMVAVLGIAFQVWLQDNVTFSPTPTAGAPRRVARVLSEKVAPEDNVEDDEAAASVADNLQRITRVIDGDTIELENGQKVRYIGVDAPESVHPRQAIQCFGQEASAYNRELVLNKRARLVKDVSETDKYGRLLRYVYLEDDTFVNMVLIKEGFARAATFPPDVKFSKDFVLAGREARAASKGLWSRCD